MAFGTRRNLYRRRLCYSGNGYKIRCGNDQIIRFKLHSLVQNTRDNLPVKVETSLNFRQKVSFSGPIFHFQAIRPHKRILPLYTADTKTNQEVSHMRDVYAEYRQGKVSWEEAYFTANNIAATVSNRCQRHCAGRRKHSRCS